MTGNAFRYGRGRCIFCGREPPEVKLSKEHVFADWLKQLFPRDEKTTHTLGAIDWSEWHSSQTPVMSQKIGQGHSGSKKIRAVCRTCNETWMSNNIEEAAKPTLTKLIRGDTFIVSSSMQKIVATWVVKTIMTAEYLRKAQAVITQKERNYLRENLEPPSGWVVYIAPFQGKHWAELAIYNNAGTLEVPSVTNKGAESHHLGLTFIGARRLFAISLYSSWHKTQRIIENMPFPQIARIWPPFWDTLHWPLEFTLTDAEAEYFTTYMARVLEQPL